jgi:hypothetical protein
MEGGDALQYVIVLSEGLTLISYDRITLGAVVCDGNTAQLKAFNPRWMNSLPRTSVHEWMKSRVFVTSEGSNLDKPGEPSACNCGRMPNEREDDCGIMPAAHINTMGK